MRHRATRKGQCHAGTGRAVAKKWQARARERVSQVAARGGKRAGRTESHISRCCTFTRTCRRVGAPRQVAWVIEALQAEKRPSEEPHWFTCCRLSHDGCAFPRMPLASFSQRVIISSDLCHFPLHPLPPPLCKRKNRASHHSLPDRRGCRIHCTNSRANSRCSLSEFTSPLSDTPVYLSTKADFVLARPKPRRSVCPPPNPRPYPPPLRHLRRCSCRHRRPRRLAARPVRAGSD